MSLLESIHIKHKKLRFEEDVLRTVLATLLALWVYIIVCIVLLCMSVKITSQKVKGSEDVLFEVATMSTPVVGVCSVYLFMFWS